MRYAFRACPFPGDEDDPLQDAININKVEGKTEQIFNLQGIRLNAIQHRGIYVVNGKKVSSK